jgi:3-hydroxymyristoyl/3-hydroxydecanoyl-(acyl carrier protein) dehydratase
MLLEKKDAIHLIPQKHPMTMVDGLFNTNDESSISRLILNKENIFCQNGFFTEPGLIENIAQTAALRSGYHASLKNQSPPIGFIGALKRIKIYKLPYDSDILKTKITVLTNLMNVSVIKGEIFVADELFAEGEMNIFLQQ